MPSSDSQLGLGFLLSLGALPIAGCPADDDDDDGRDPTGADTAPTSDATADPTGGTDPTSASMDATDTAMTDATDTADTGGTTGDESCGAIPPTCQEWADAAIACGEGYADANYCACALMYYEQYGAGCAQALEDLYACLAELSCDEMAAEDACPAEDAALESACDFGDGGSSGG